MPQYIESNAGLLQSLIAAQNASAANKTQTTRSIAEAVAGAINKHYESKEMQITAAKEAKTKEIMGAIEYLAKNNLLKIPEGTTGDISVEGYQPIPTGMQEILKQQGISSTFSQPRERAIDVTVTPEQYTQVMTQYKDKPEIAKKLLTTTQPGMKYMDFVKSVQVATKEPAVKPISPTDTIEQIEPELIGQYGVPASRPNPYKGMSETTLSKVKSANIATGNGTLEKAQSAAELAASTSASLARANALLDAGLMTGPIVGASETARKMASKEAAEFIQIANLTLPSMRQGMPGVVSDRDMEIFKRANIGISQPADVNRKILKQGLAINNRIADKARFLSNYMSAYGDVQGATMAWNKYINANPLFDKDGNVKEVIPFEQYFTQSGMTKKEPITKPSTKPVPKDEIDKALDDIFK